MFVCLFVCLLACLLVEAALVWQKLKALVVGERDEAAAAESEQEEEEEMREEDGEEKGKRTESWTLTGFLTELRRQKQWR